MKSFQNLILLQNLYRLKSLGFEYSDPFLFNTKNSDDKPSNIKELEKRISTCHLCDLSKSRTQSMSGYGNPHAKIMIIDFSVSLSDDNTNSYYSGRSGEILTNMIVNVLKLKPEDIYFTHAIKCKTLNSNTPSSSEWGSCKSYLFAQINFVKPEIVITLGDEAYARVTSDDTNFENVRGHVIDFKEYKLVPIYHPQYLLRNPQMKQIAFNDLKTIKSLI